MTDDHPMQGTELPASPEKSPTHLSREQILTVTATCLHELGYEATTIRQIAGRLQCAVGSIYRYFTDKRELMLEVTQRMFEPVLILLDADGTFEDSAMLYHVQATQGLEAYRLMFWLTCVGNNTEKTAHKTANKNATKHAEPNPPRITATPHDGTTMPPLPRDIRIIIDRWAQRLDNPDAALRAWAVMHGAINAGLGAATSLAAMHAAARLDGLDTIPHHAFNGSIHHLDNSALPPAPPHDTHQAPNPVHSVNADVSSGSYASPVTNLNMPRSDDVTLL